MIESTLIGAVVGLAGSVATPIVDYFKDKQKHKHEIELQNLQIEATKVGAELELEKIRETATDDELKALLDHDTKTENHIFKALVRPLYAYVLLGLFLIFKVTAFSYGISTEVPMPEIVSTVWDEPTHAIFMSVIFFYFGSRAFGKARKLSKS